MVLPAAVEQFEGYATAWGSSPTRLPSLAAGAVQLEVHDEWAIAERRYLGEGSI